jgi:hypothetical protein
MISQKRKEQNRWLAPAAYALAAVCVIGGFSLAWHRDVLGVPAATALPPSLTGTKTSSTNRMVSQSTVKVFYDPQTFLPTSLEYSIHPDDDDSQDIPVKVAFSNYQSVSGVMLPYHIERFVSRTLQLKLDVTNVSID